MLELLPTLPSDDSDPRHKRVQAVLRDLVSSGRLRPGDKIAAEVQIAHALGVSKMTVNKALLALAADGVFVREVGRGTFVAEPRRPVRAPEGKIVPLATVKPLTVAVSFVSGGKNIADTDYYWNLYQGIGEAFASETPQIALHVPPVGVSDYQAEQERAPVDARIVVAPRQSSTQSLNTLWRAGLPVVVLGAAWPDLMVPCVDSDNRGGATRAVANLLHLGHKRVALLTAEPDTGNTQDRSAGFRAALHAARLPFDATLEIEAASFLRMGGVAHDRLTQLFFGENPVTAVFAAGYYLALEAMNAVRGVGLRVPEDVSIVGFDDPLSAQWAYPPLTTVRQPLPVMGRRAGELLLAQLQSPDSVGKKNEKPVVLPAELMVRGSTAAAPNAPPGVGRIS